MKFEKNHVSDITAQRRGGAVLLIIAFLLNACSKSPDPVNPGGPMIPTNPPVTLYIAGEGFNSGKNVALYWKDSARVILSDSSNQQDICGISVSGNDVYLAGTQWGPLATPKALSWKNGVATAMTETYSNTTGIAVSGGDVYISGSVRDMLHSKTAAAYWKNGSIVNLDGDSSTYVYATAITLSGSDIYVAGNRLVPPGAPDYRYVARYWKNGVVVDLSDTSEMATATSIFVSGNDVFVAGNKEPVGSKGMATYWKNGSPVVLTDGTSAANLTGVYVSNNDVYVCGNITDPANGNPIATYWKNGTPFTLTTGTTPAGSMTTAISGSGSDVYIVGTVDNIPTYWKNGVAVKITPSGMNDAATGIFLVPKQ